MWKGYYGTPGQLSLVPTHSLSPNPFVFVPLVVSKGPNETDGTSGSSSKVATNNPASAKKAEHTPQDTKSTPAEAEPAASGAEPPTQSSEVVTPTDAPAAAMPEA